MSGESGSKRVRDPVAHERLDEHEEIHEHHDRRISTNENWRLQAQGAMKILAVIVGAGGIGFIFDTLGLI